MAYASVENGETCWRSHRVEDLLLTSPPVMVAPRPLEPLVLYLAATVHSASTSLMAVREERAGADARRSAPCIAAPLPPKDGALEASTAPPDGKDPEAPSSQAGLDIVNTSSLVEHPCVLCQHGVA